MHLIGKHVDLTPRKEAVNSFKNLIFVQLLMKINFKWLPVETILMQFTFVMMFVLKLK